MAHSQDIINECWRSIDGYINYQVSNTGRVRNALNGKILVGRYKHGYAYVPLRQAGVGKEHRIHRLVAEQFIPKPDSNYELEVDHIINNETNNAVSNLRWVPHRQNMWNRDKIRKETSSKYIGVCFNKQRHKWRATISENDGHWKHIGTFQNEKDAARACNAKAYELRGSFAVLNDISDDDA